MKPAKQKTRPAFPGAEARVVAPQPAAISWWKWLLTAFGMLNSLSMEEMLQALTAVGRPVLQSLFARRFAFARGLGMPRMEYAMSVALNRKLPLIAPGDLLKTSQVQTAARFLGTGAPTRASFDLRVLGVDTLAVTQPSKRAKQIQEMKDVFASQGGAFELDVASHPSKLSIGEIKSQENRDKLKALVDPLATGAPDRLVVVFGDFLVPGRNGETTKSTSNKVFCIVDTSSLGADSSTMIHESGHAAGLDHIEDEARASRPVAVWDESNIMREAPTMGRTTLTVGQGEQYSQASFAKKK
jgi:hypothetical protein